MGYGSYGNRPPDGGLDVARPDFGEQRRPRPRPHHRDGVRPDSIRGRIARYDQRTGYGVIAGGDGVGYGFYGDEWRDPGPPLPGMEVDFLSADGLAFSVTRLATSAPTRARKSRVAAAVLAILVGEFGIHKFYLGYPAQGFLLLFGFVLSFVLWVFGIGLIMTLAIIVIAIVEFVIYLSKSDEDFHQTYVVNRRAWF